MSSSCWLDLVLCSMQMEEDVLCEFLSPQPRDDWAMNCRSLGLLSFLIWNSGGEAPSGMHQLFHHFDSQTDKLFQRSQLKADFDTGKVKKTKLSV